VVEGRVDIFEAYIVGKRVEAFVLEKPLRHTPGIRDRVEALEVEGCVEAFFVFMEEEHVEEFFGKREDSFEVEERVNGVRHARGGYAVEMYAGNRVEVLEVEECADALEAEGGTIYRSFRWSWEGGRPASGCNRRAT
jgi:hypothetical protein